MKRTANQASSRITPTSRSGATYSKISWRDCSPAISAAQENPNR